MTTCSLQGRCLSLSSLCVQAVVANIVTVRWCTARSPPAAPVGCVYLVQLPPGLQDVLLEVVQLLINLHTLRLSLWQQEQRQGSSRQWGQPRTASASEKTHLDGSCRTQLGSASVRQPSSVHCLGRSLQGAPRCVRNLEHLYALVYRWQAGSSSHALTAAKNYVTKNLERFRHWACSGSPALPAAAAPAACAAARPAWLLPWLTPQPWRQPLPQPAGNSTHMDDWVVFICHHAMHVVW